MMTGFERYTKKAKRALFLQSKGFWVRCLKEFPWQVALSI